MPSSHLAVETPSLERSRSPTPLHLKDFVHDFIVKMRNEKNSEAHQIFRSYPGHAPKGLPQTINPEEETVPGIQHPGSTGVIYCTDRAMANGFVYGDPAWSNLGQGAPEVGDIPDAPPRPQTVNLPHDSLEYAPTTGVKELRKAVADLYNHTYRQGKKSQYTHENVCIVPGGRAGLSRVAAVVGDVYCGYQVPEYTTYSEVLSVFKRLVPIPTALTPESRYKIDINQAKKDISSQGLQVIVASNPRNPTGQLIQGEELKDLVRLCDHHCTVVLDEFYSWYIYPKNEEEAGKSISGAAYVEDVNDDAVVLIDGLTKNWRLPGWRVCWVVGPKNLISALSQSGSFLDGGANHPLQLAALPLLDPEHVRNEKLALQKHFKAKRDHVLKRLAKMGMEVSIPPEATFYIWLDLRGLPAPLNDGLTFFEELLREKTIVVPGIFFEINPSHRRDLFSSPCHHFVRISFGPPIKDLDKGLDALERILRRAKKEGMNKIGVDLVKSPTENHFPGVH
ncbi:Aminotransferase, classes I and II [Ceratobasidium theobromae]|uniref:Aminotransferase, classes I and II n=1 Tax=Ceratobasidium theobromae TaxID=1582974 RepID=A0A5N5QXA8_9AGAM|nr:Aminotransferase, classes I and II [Ceratobasidium theobromae]